MFLDEQSKVIEHSSTLSPLAVGVPGTVDGMVQAHKKFGSLPFADLVAPAMELAQKGFPVTAMQAKSLNGNRENFIKYNKVLPAFVKEGEWQVGDLLVQEELFNTLRLIAENELMDFIKAL